MRRFFQDPSGKLSMARLIAFGLLLEAAAVTLAAVVHLLRAPDAGVLAAVAAVLGALVGGGAVAIMNRVRGSE